MKTPLLYFFTLLLIVQTHAQDWTLSNKSVAGYRHFFDDFGTVVDISGNYAIIGDPKHGFDAANASPLQNAGAAYIFEKTPSGEWAEVQKLVASDRTAHSFGETVSISGNYAVVGVKSETRNANGTNALASAGAVYVFERNASGQWLQVQKIVPSDRAVGDNFGASVAIDGNNLVIGALGIDPTTLPADQEAGGFYYFKRNASGTWVEQEVVFADTPFGGDQLGGRIALDGNHLVVSAPQADGQVQNVGVAYIFELVSGQWEEVAYITTPQNEANDSFGSTIAISGDYALVGSTSLGSTAGGNGFLADVGAVHVYKKAANGTWSSVQELTAPTPVTGGGFGSSASIDGTTIVIGASLQDVGNKGMAYVFNLDNGTWSETQSISGEVDADIFGNAVAISGENIMISAPGQDTDEDGLNTVNGAGAVYFYENVACTPADKPTLSASESELCGGGSVTLSINSGGLNGAEDWKWYKGACGTGEVGNGETVTLSVTTTTTFYARGEGSCDPGECGEMTIEVNALPSPTILNEDAKTLSVKETFNAYQWVTCEGRSLTPIKGEDSKSFVPQEANDYNVIVIDRNGCEGNAKECVSFVITSTNNVYFSEIVSVYPNPSSNGMVNVSLGSSYKDVSYHLYTNMGKRIASQYVGSAEAFQVELPVDQGIYLLEIHTANGNTTTLKITHQ